MMSHIRLRRIASAAPRSIVLATITELIERASHVTPSAPDVVASERIELASPLGVK